MKQTNKTPKKSILPTLESMPQVHAVTGMPLGIIREAKKSGCAAFITGNRIALEPLLKWFFSEFDDAADRPPDGLHSWREALNRAQTKREELRLERERGELMSADEACRQAAAAMGLTFSELDRISRECPPALQGLDAVGVHKRLSAEIARMRETLREKFDEIGKE
jgi:hypothetical protein